MTDAQAENGHGEDYLMMGIPLCCCCNDNTIICLGPAWDCPYFYREFIWKKNNGNR